MRTPGLWLALTVILLAAACGPPDQPPEPLQESVTNELLGIRLDPLPPDFAVAVNDDRGLELAPVEAKVGGRVVFEVGDEEPLIDLVAAVHRHQRRVEEMPGADYKGGQELVTPLGSAFYSRGRYLAGAELVEDTVLVSKHPSSNRLLVISYRYPAGADSSVRVQQLLEIVTVLQGAATAGAAAGE
jgi:hypothetical protein